LDVQQGRHTPVETLVDLTAIPEMNLIELRLGQLYIGAAAPLRLLAESPLVKQHAQALVEACGQVGGPQVRNAATLGGNVAHALPAADGSIALAALEAQAEVAAAGGRRCVAMGELYKGPGRSALEPGREILVGFWLPLCSMGQASAFQRVMRPQGVALPVLNTALWLSRDGERIGDARLAFGPAGPVPFRARQTEAILRGRPLNAETLAQAQAALLAEARFRTSPQRATAEYRQHLAGHLLAEILAKVWERTDHS
jgi:carbon-monoxide dehydrogenase medium subunit